MNHDKIQTWKSLHIILIMLLTGVSQLSADVSVPPVLALEVQLKDMKLITADWNSTDYEHLQCRIAQLLQCKKSLYPWNLGIDGEDTYKLLFTIMKSETERIHVDLQLVVNDAIQKTINLTPDHFSGSDYEALKSFTTEKLAKWIVDLLTTPKQDKNGIEQGENGLLSLLRERLRKHVPIASEGNWEFMGNQRYVSLPLAQNRYSNLRRERFDLDYERIQSNVEVGNLYAFGIGAWSLQRDMMMIKPAELQSAKQCYDPNKMPIHELQKLTLGAVHLHNLDEDLPCNFKNPDLAVPISFDRIRALPNSPCTTYGRIWTCSQTD